MEQYQALLLLGMWIGSHLLLFNLIRAPTSRLTLILCLTILCTVYLLKPATSDLSRYSVYFNSGFLTNKAYTVNTEGDVLVDPIDVTGEPFYQAFNTDRGFAALSRLFSLSGTQRPFLPRLAVFKKRYVADGPILGIMLIGVVGLIWSCSRAVDTRQRRVTSVDPPVYLYWLPVILGSLFFLLGSQNALRQFLGVVFVIIGVCALFEQRFLWSLIATALATLMHHWSLGFMAIFVGLMIGQNICQRIVGSNSVFRNLCNYLLSGLVLGCLGVFVVKSVVSGAVFNIWESIFNDVVPYVVHNHGFVFSEIKQYVWMDFSHLPSRSGAITKLVLLGCVIILSEFILGSSSLPARWNVRGYRVAVFGFLIPFGIYPEILSRLFIFYLAIELIYICMAIVSQERRAQVAAMVVFAGYSVAPNGINTLLGHEWLARLVG